jgi:hypothetical protein
MQHIPPYVPNCVRKVILRQIEVQQLMGERDEEDPELFFLHEEYDLLEEKILDAQMTWLEENSDIVERYLREKYKPNIDETQRT